MYLNIFCSHDRYMGRYLHLHTSYRHIYKYFSIAFEIKNQNTFPTTYAYQ
jgi:hypothetical protein